MISSYSSSQSGFVRANSVQNQFTNLSREKDNFVRQKEQADADQKRTQVRLQQLKGRQTDLMKQIQSTQHELGTISRKQHLLKQEQGRVDRVFHSERKALEDCAMHTQALEQKERELTANYYKEMGKLNDEISSLLQDDLSAKTETLLSVETVEAVIADKIPDSLSRELFLEKLDMMKKARENWEMTKAGYQKPGLPAAAGEEGPVENEADMNNPSEETMPPQNLDAPNPVVQKQMDLFYGSDSNHSVEQIHHHDTMMDSNHSFEQGRDEPMMHSNHVFEQEHADFMMKSSSPSVEQEPADTMM